VSEYLENPRRAPRAPARCRVIVLTSRGRFEGETADVGPRGCRIVSPGPVRPGEAVHLEISNEKLREVLQLNAHVVWTSASAPWRLGIAFSPVGDRAHRWFGGLLAAHPGLEGHGRVPERIALDATVHLRSPPGVAVEFTREEFEVLRAVASGARIEELRSRFQRGWPRARRAIFSLLATRHLTFSPREAVDPARWTRILHDADLQLALRSLDEPAALTPPPAPAPLAEARTPPPLPTRIAAPAPVPTPGPTRNTAPTPVPTAARGVEVAASTQRDGWMQDRPRGRRAQDPDFVGAGVGWRTPPRTRSREADEQFRRGLAELESGRHASALAHLRLAIRLAPGDPEIAQKLGLVAFDRP
jgi:hypothetical protein